MTTFRREYGIGKHLKNLAESGLHYDLVIVTKENLKLRAHKAVLCRDEFWYNLLKEEGVCSRTCSSLPTTLLFPDYDYRTVKLMLRGYYQESLDVAGTEVQEFLKIVQSFNLQAYNNICRICDIEVESSEVTNHLIQHIKLQSTQDIQSYKQAFDKETIKCSFTHPNSCTIEKDRSTMTQGYFNNVNVTTDSDMINQIKQHYRRHLRDELTHVNKGFLDESQLPRFYTAAGLASSKSDTEESELETTEETLDDAEDQNNKKRARRGSSDSGLGAAVKRLKNVTGQATELRRLDVGVEGEDLDNVSDDEDCYGGMSSPEEQSDETGELEVKGTAEEEDAAGQREKKIVEHNTKDKENDEQKQNQLDSDESDNELEEEGQRSRKLSGKGSDQAKCKLCRKEFPKPFFRNHLIASHFINLWEEEVVGAQPFFCNKDKCDGKKAWKNRKNFIRHKGTVHKELDMKLVAKGQTLSDFEMEIEDGDKIIEEQLQMADPVPILKAHGISIEDRHTLTGSKSPAASRPVTSPTQSVSNSSDSSEDSITRRLSTIKERRKSESDGGSSRKILDLTTTSSGATSRVSTDPPAAPVDDNTNGVRNLLRGLGASGNNSSSVLPAETKAENGRINVGDSVGVDAKGQDNVGAETDVKSDRKAMINNALQSLEQVSDSDSDTDSDDSVKTEPAENTKYQSNVEN